MKVGQTGNNNQAQTTESAAAKKSGKAQAPKNGNNAASNAESGSSVSEGASAKISLRAKELSKAKETAANAPDIREEKVAELKRRMAAGQYSVDANAVADKLVDDHIKNSAMG